MERYKSPAIRSMAMGPCGSPNSKVQLRTLAPCGAFAQGRVPARATARYAARSLRRPMGARFASGYATAGELHHVRGHDRRIRDSYTGHVGGDYVGFRPNSRLLVIAGMPQEHEARDGVAYFEWTGSSLKFIRSVPRLKACPTGPD